MRIIKWLVVKLINRKYDKGYDAGFDYAAGRLLRFENINAIRRDAERCNTDDPFDHGVRDALWNFEKMVDALKIM